MFAGCVKLHAHKLRFGIVTLSAAQSFSVASRLGHGIQSRGLAYATVPQPTTVEDSNIPPASILPPGLLKMTVDPPLHRRKVKKAFPAVLMRAGTSKGLFIQRQYLPALMSDWSPQLLAAMGSSHSDKRQIDGVGGATSTTSKVAVVSPSNIPGVDVEYTFVQVAVGKDAVDFSGSCGNMAAGVGPFAIQEGMVKVEPGQSTVGVRILNTNTGRLIVETVEVNEDGEVEEDGDFVIAGAKGSGSEIKVSFVEPAGSMTNKLFPTGQRREFLTVEDPNQPSKTFNVEATLIDVANPFILVDQRTLPADIQQLDPGSDRFMTYAEAIRQVGAVEMGLATSLEAASLVRGTPKIAMALNPATSSTQEKDEANLDANIQAFSMGKPHPTLQITGAVCIAASVAIPGTVTQRILAGQGPSSEDQLLTPESMSVASDSEDAEPAAADDAQKSTVTRPVRIGHPTGVVDVETHLSFKGEDVTVERCVVSRTARRIFEGKVMYYTEA